MNVNKEQTRSFFVSKGTSMKTANFRRDFSCCSFTLRVMWERERQTWSSTEQQSNGWAAALKRPGGRADAGNDSPRKRRGRSRVANGGFIIDQRKDEALEAELGQSQWWEQQPDCVCVCLCKNPGLQLALLLCRGTDLVSSAVLCLRSDSFLHILAQQQS